MKIAVSALGETPDSPLDSRFGRARFFILMDGDTGEWSAHANTPNLEALQGAGIQAAQFVAGLGAEAVITGHCGPKAFATLAAASIPVFADASGTVREAVEACRSGALRPAGGADVGSGYGSV